MRRGTGVAACVAALTAVVTACDSPVTEPVGGKTALAVDVEFVGTADQVLESGMVRLRGPSDRNVSINPGETRDITGLEPGSYAVALEGRVGGEVQVFGERTNVNVVAEQITPVTVQLASFVPTVTNVPGQVAPGADFTVEWSQVQGAENYQIEASESSDFSTILFSQSTSSTSFVFTADPGIYYFRVRAINRFDARGVPSEASAGVTVLASLGVAGHGAVLRATDTFCSTGFQAIGFEEIIEYESPDGEFPSSGNFLESEGPVESQLRFESDADWESYGFDRQWSVLSGSTSTAGSIRAGVCFASADGEDYLDLRVRLVGSQGATDWNEVRLWLPDMVEITNDVPVLSSGGSVHLSAVVRDVNGDIVPGDPVSWSNFNGAVGSVDSEGNYVLDGDDGLDQVYARAGYAHDNVGVDGPSGWWAPCWRSAPFGGAEDSFINVRMAAYEGQEYQFLLRDPTDGSVTGSGDADLYLRLDMQATTSTYDRVSAGETHTEDITWTPPTDGTTWLGIHGYSDYSNVEFYARTTDGQCGFPGNGVDPAAVGGPATAEGHAPGRTDDMGARVAPTRSAVTHPPVPRSSATVLRSAGEERR